MPSLKSLITSLSVSDSSTVSAKREPSGDRAGSSGTRPGGKESMLVRAPSRSKRTSTDSKLGKVLIAVGSGGLSEDLMVVNVSELAERDGKTEGEIEWDIADKGHALITVEEFKPLVSWLKEEVLSGRVSLPYHPSGPSLTPAARAIRLRIRR